MRFERPCCEGVVTGVALSDRLCSPQVLLTQPLCIWQVVLVIRGTTSLADALTDLSGHLVPFGGGGGEGDVLKGNNTVDGSDSAAGSSGSSDDSQHGSQGTAATASSEGGDDSSGSRDGNGTGGGAADTSRRQAGSGSSSSGGCSNAEGDSEGMAHHGILKAAQSLLQQQGDALGQLLQDNPGHKLKVQFLDCRFFTAALLVC